MDREWLKKIRNEKGMSQFEMASFLQIPQSTYSYYEIGMRNPKIKKAKRLAKLLEINWTKFYENQEIKEE